MHVHVRTMHVYCMCIVIEKSTPKRASGLIWNGLTRRVPRTLGPKYYLVSMVNICYVAWLGNGKHVTMKQGPWSQIKLQLRAEPINHICTQLFLLFMLRLKS